MKGKQKNGGGCQARKRKQTREGTRRQRQTNKGNEKSSNEEYKWSWVIGVSLQSQHNNQRAPMLLQQTLVHRRHATAQRGARICGRRRSHPSVRPPMAPAEVAPALRAASPPRPLNGVGAQTIPRPASAVKDSAPINHESGKSRPNKPGTHDNEGRQAHQTKTKPAKLTWRHTRQR